MPVDSPEHRDILPREPDAAAVLGQLSRLLASPHFSHSQRFPSFLRFVVEYTLAKQTDPLKERTIGSEVFGKNLDYDTASDPIVRVTAAEIRKRIAMYYQEPGHQDELEISLPPGSYVPQFQWPKGAEDLGRSVPHPAHTHLHSPLILALTCFVAGSLSVGLVFLWQANHHSALDFFWQPVLSSGEPVLLCMADQIDTSGQFLRDASDPTRQVQMKPLNKATDNLTTVAIDDLASIVKVAGLMQSNRIHYGLRGESATSLTDLRTGPTIFFGAFDNAWTLRMTNPLHYHFANNAAMTEVRIVDNTAANQSRWVVQRSDQVATNNYRDYGIVARFTDTNTGKLTVIVAGLARGGTIAAGEFLTNSDDLEQLQRAALTAGNKKNMEVVLSTQIIDGEPGSPKMEATYFW